MATGETFHMSAFLHFYSFFMSWVRLISVISLDMVARAVWYVCDMHMNDPFPTNHRIVSSTLATGLTLKSMTMFLLRPIPSPTEEVFLLSESGWRSPNIIPFPCLECCCQGLCDHLGWSWLGNCLLQQEFRLLQWFWKMSWNVRNSRTAMKIPYFRLPGIRKGSIHC